MTNLRKHLISSSALAATALFLAGLAPLASAQEAVSELRAETVIVTGTRTEGRTVLESTVPVDVVNADDIASSSTLGGELGSALQTLVPSFSFSRQSNSSSTDVVRFGQLRGLNPDQVLVLVNGKRRHTTSVVSLDAKIGRGTTPVDFNSIPLSSISRIEVLRDGAGAQYGSDAVAGVINVILKGADAPGELNASYGFHRTDFEPTGETLEDGQTYSLGVSKGFSLGDNGFIQVGADYRDRGKTSRGGAINEFAFLFGVEPDSPLNRTFAGRPGLYRPGDPDVTDLNLWANGELEIADGLTAYGFATYNDREGEGAAFYRYPDGPAGVPGLYPVGYRPITTNDNTDISLVGGLQGETAGWSWDTSVNYGENEFEAGVRNSANPSLGTASPTSFRSATFNNSQIVVNFDASREISLGTIAAGVEYRHEDYSTEAGDPASYAVGPLAALLGKRIGAQAGFGLSPEDAASVSRDVGAIYAELSAEPLPGLLLDVAGRYENYSDAGDAVAGKVAARYAVNDVIGVRGSVSNSFRAPSLSQTAFQFTSTSFGSGGALTTVRTVAPGSRIGQALGAPELEPETSVNFSAGVTADFGNFGLSVDAFRIDVDDRIIVSERNFGFENTILAATGIPNVTDVAVFTNGADTRTEGVEFVGTWSGNAGPGELDLSLAYALAETEVRAVKQASSFVPGYVVLGVEERNTIETAAPKDRLVGSAGYTLGRLGLLARATRQGETTRIFNFGGGFEPEQTYGAKTQLDLEASWQVNDAIEVAAGGNNVLDEYPDRSVADIAYFDALPYDVLSPIGINGTYWYVRTRITF